MTRTPWVAAAALAATLLTSQPASAQERYDFRVPFNFVAGRTVFPAGQYVFAVDPVEGVLAITPSGPGQPSVLLPIEARVYESKPPNHAEVVFSAANGQRRVSELLIPDGDGYAVPVLSTVPH